MEQHPDADSWAWAYLHHRSAELASVKPRLAGYLLAQYRQATTLDEAERIGLQIELVANAELYE